MQREIVAPGDEVSFGDVVLSFDALKEMMIDKLGGAADGAHGGANGGDGVGRRRSPAPEPTRAMPVMRPTPRPIAHGGNGSAGPSGKEGPGGTAAALGQAT